MNTDLTNPEWFHDYHPVIRHGTWDENIFREQIHYAPLNIEAGTVVLDIGAHIGAFALWCLQFNPHMIHCYEPDKINYKILQLNVLEREDVSINNYALTPDRITPQSAFFYINKTNSGMNSFIERKGSDQVVDIVGIRDWRFVIVEVRPRFMKMDIEGLEYEIEWHLLKDSSIQRFVVEYHFDIEDATEKAAKMHQDIQDAGYKLYHGGDFSHAHQTLGFYERQ